MKLGPAILACAFVTGLVGTEAASDAQDAIREGFEGKSIRDLDPRFLICHRPENRFRLSPDRSRSGKQSLELSINPPALATLASNAFKLSPKNCLLDNEEESFEHDDYERAEIWEDKNRNPRFGAGSDMFYGFSMWVDARSASATDFNRLVVGQWKAGCEGWCDVSPFLGQRLTGGFYHITLDVDAYSETAGRQEGKTCKLLLAFTGERPELFDAPLALDRPTQCESRLQYPPLTETSLKPDRKIEIKRERFLPNPFGTWTDLVFRVDGGQTDGVIQVWANGQLIATATGWIGHRISRGMKQYFKFGPYRDPAGYGVTVYLDNLSRGSSYDEVDPNRFQPGPR